MKIISRNVIAIIIIIIIIGNTALEASSRSYSAPLHLEYFVGHRLQSWIIVGSDFRQVVRTSYIEYLVKLSPIYSSFSR